MEILCCGAAILILLILGIRIVLGGPFRLLVEFGEQEPEGEEDEEDADELDEEYLDVA